MTNWEHYYLNINKRPFANINFYCNTLKMTDYEDHEIYVEIYDDAVLKIYKKWKIVDMFYESYLHWLHEEYNPDKGYIYNVYLNKDHVIRRKLLK